MGQINDVPFIQNENLKIISTDPFVTEKVSDIKLKDSKTKLVDSKTKLVDSKTKLVDSKTKLVSSDDDSKRVDSTTKLVGFTTPLVNSTTADEKPKPVKASPPKPLEVKSTDASSATTKKESSPILPGPISKTHERNKTKESS